jgi:iron complex transport system ATP-binding protein
MTDLAFSLDQVRYTPDHTLILADVSLDVSHGHWIGILGPNGAGKSTLLRIMAGVLPASSGIILFEGQALEQWSTRERAKQLAFLPQRTDLSFPFRVREVVAMGRTPYLERWQNESEADERIVEQTMALTEISRLADRNVLTLSGGEFQQVMLARALAQQPTFLLLDEPTTGLDLRHQFEVVDVLTTLVQQGVTIITVLHDLNMAASACASVVLLKSGRVYAAGPPQDILTVEAIRAVYGVDVALGENPETGALQIIPLRATRPTG